MMYGEDELVDETEEIVLERSRHNLRRRLALRELWLENRKRILEVNEPRKEEKLAQDLEQRRAELRAARKSNEHSAEGRVMSEMRTIRGFEKRKRSLKRLEALLEGLTIRAPADGILLHGPLRGGASRRFLPGTSVNVAEGVVSIADPSSLVAVLFVPSKEMLRLTAGSKVEITPDVTGAEAIEAKIDRISALPGTAGFEIRCHLPTGTSPRLFGATLKASIVLEQADDVLSVPSNCVLKAGGRAFCMVEGKDGLVPVKIGRDDGRSSAGWPRATGCSRRRRASESPRGDPRDRLPDRARRATGGGRVGQGGRREGPGRGEAEDRGGARPGGREGRRHVPARDAERERLLGPPRPAQPLPDLLPRSGRPPLVPRRVHRHSSSWRFSRCPETTSDCSRRAGRASTGSSRTRR
jgi:hypothetical protein